MNWLFRLLFFIFIPLSVNSQTYVKVLLDEAEQNHEWVFDSDGKIVISLPSNEKRKKVLNKNLCVSIRNNQIYLNNKLYKNNVIKISPRLYKHLTVNNDPYNGTFFILKHEGNILLINQVELENYICSVLKTESWPGWPKEVNKVLAIACRSYVMAKIVEHKKKNRKPYHVRNTNHHQTYSGIHNKVKIKEAVHATKDTILGYNNVPILAMFDSCCGGLVPAHIDGFNFNKHPYLARDYACTFCKDYKIYSWQADYPHKEFHKIIKSQIPKLKRIKKLRTKTDKAGTVQKLTIHGSCGTYEIEKQELYKLFKNVKSFCFSIYRHANSVRVNGVGYGHHIGLCQWGARQMVSEGFNYKEILQFYYPDTNFMKIKE